VKEELKEKLKTVMKKFIINYTPAVHEGQENTEEKSYFYRVEMDEQFANREERDHSAGMSAKDTETGLWKRFRWDRIKTAVAI
jgi:hypothetical protein